MNRILKSLIKLIIIAIMLAGCQKTGEPQSLVKPELPSSVKILAESQVQEITLLGPASEAHAEFSGMAWCGSNLVLLPQYPHKFGEDGSANLFSIPESSLRKFISGEIENGIQPELIPFQTEGIEKLIKGFEGFEAIVFTEEGFYVTVEARDGGQMAGYLFAGSVEGSCERLVLDAESMQTLQPQAAIGNKSHETLVIFGDNLYAIYEANGINVNPGSVARVFDKSLQSRSEVDMVNIEYRITDAAEPDESGEFWAINYFFPGDSSDIKPALDQIALEYGVGESHRDAEPVERLVKFAISENGIILVDQPPIYLALGVVDSRNWEGLVRFGEGFLLVTDKFPTTILAHVEEVDQD